MPSLPLEQALFHRPDGDAPRLVARSSGFADACLADAERLVLGFGERTNGRRCPPAVFAMPIAPKHVAVVRVMDDCDASGLRFHFLVFEQVIYEGYIRDPFMLAEKVEATWEHSPLAPGGRGVGGEGVLPTLMLAPDTFSPRKLAQVQAVLKRVKASALAEGEDPASPDFSRTIENSESPALLGGAQILVDGGRLVFQRSTGDLPLVSGLWLLLPEMTRCRLWPTTFAFSAELEFDVLVVPHVDDELLEHYTTEDQAADYPEGAYELALQRAVENDNQEDLDIVFSKRDGRQTLRLALIILVLVSGLVIAIRWLTSS